MLKTVQEVEQYLWRKGLVSDPRELRVNALSGGVSGHVWKVSQGNLGWVLKQALPKLGVEVDWYADVGRILREADALQVVHTLLPASALPQVVHVDPDEHLYIMTLAPERAAVWKHLLLGGEFDPVTAARAGELLATLHAGSRRLPAESRHDLDDITYFVQLRIDPFHRYLQGVYPELHLAVDRLVTELVEDRSCFVHGDFSPKNILVVPDDGHLILLDYEVAHWGNPVFDVAFLLAHLLLKGWALRQRERAAELIELFLSRYGLAPAHLLEHTALLLLARLDGKSPVDYVKGEALRQYIREVALRWLRDPPASAAVEAIVHTLKGGDAA